MSPWGGAATGTRSTRPDDPRDRNGSKRTGDTVKRYQAKKGCQDQDGIGTGPGTRARDQAREAAGPGRRDDRTTGDQMIATHSHKFKL